MESSLLNHHFLCAWFLTKHLLKALSPEPAWPRSQQHCRHSSGWMGKINFTVEVDAWAFLYENYYEKLNFKSNPFH